MQLSPDQETRLRELLGALVDQQRARVVVPANEPREGFWFGGGNLVRDDDGALWASGRYRDVGDSRTGVEAGLRGLELALFRSMDGGETFSKQRSWSKADLSREDARVLSIEGTALHRTPDGGWELFVSTEKELHYPEGLEGYQKLGTGVWSVDRFTGSAPDRLDVATLAPVLSTSDARYLHVKDPAVYDAHDGTHLLFCTHPASWASNNTGHATWDSRAGVAQVRDWQMVPRGNVWDVAATRITNRMPVPRCGAFADGPGIAVLFYDGAESMRRLDENPRALARPRGYSCEELGGASWAPADGAEEPRPLSVVEPLFVSPFGTGSSRYVSTLVTNEGIYATWQQGQEDLSQPLVMNFLPMSVVERLLAE